MLSALRRLFTVILRHPLVPARAVQPSPLPAPSSSPGPTLPRIAPTPLPSHHVAPVVLGAGGGRSGARRLACRLCHQRHVSWNRPRREALACRRAYLSRPTLEFRVSEARSAATTPRRTTRKRRDIRERMERAVLDHWELLDDEDIAIFTIRRPDGSDFATFEAGQYTMLAFWDQPTDDPRPRQLSIGSTPLDLDHLEFYVILVRDSREDGSNIPGVFTGTLWRHKPGDEILYMPRPAGRFTLSRTSQPDAVCVATGTGLAPFVSMARTAWHEYQETGQVERRLTIVHGVSYADQLGYKDELERMAADPGFGLVYIPTISRPDSDPNFGEGMGRGRANDTVRLICGKEMSGRVEPWLPDEPLAALQERMTPEGAALYLCGNPEMIADAKPVLAEQGFETEGRESQVITEDYW